MIGVERFFICWFAGNTASYEMSFKKEIEYSNEVLCIPFKKILE